MGSASSRKKGSKSKSKTVTLSEATKRSGKIHEVKSKTPGRENKDGGQRGKKVDDGGQKSKNAEAAASKGKKTEGEALKGKRAKTEGRPRSNTQSNVNPFEGDRSHGVMRSKSEPGDVLSSLNKDLSTSLRLSDFCKIHRKERVEADEAKPIYIPYKTSDKPTVESLCHICSVYTGSETYTCSVCCRVYHESCLAKIGQCENEAVRYLHTSLEPPGWSCHLCDNVSNILTNEEFTVLLDMFRICNISAEEDLSHDQYLAYRKWHYKRQLGADMTSEELREELCVIGQLSKGLNGRISWKSFLNHEALKLLEKRNENSLVRLLTDSEIASARKTVQLRDTSGQGDITRTALLHLTSQYDNIFHVTYRPEKIMFADDDVAGSVNWERFLREMAIFLIAGRLNIFRQAVTEARKCADAEVASKATTPKCIARMTIMTRPTPRKGSSRSMYMNNGACGRLVGDSQVLKRPLSLA